MVRQLRKIFGTKARLSSLSVVWIFVAAYIILFSFLSIIRYYSFITNAWDLGELSQSMWTTLHGGGIFQNNVVFDSEFHVHFRPILFLLLPIYAIFESPVTLLVLQSILIGLAAVPLYWIAKQELKSKIAIVFPILYLLYPALHGVNWFDFHPESFVPLFIFLAFFYYKNNKFSRYFLFVVLALMTKEDVSLVVISLGLYFLILNRKSLFKHPVSKEVLMPLATVCIGVIWLAASLRIIQYFLQAGGYGALTSGGYVHTKNEYARLGGDGGLLNVIKTIVTNPVLFFQVLFSDYGTKLIYLIALFLPVAFLPLLDYSAILFLPSLLEFLLASSPNYYSIYYQYPSLLIPGIFIAAIYGMKRLRCLKPLNHAGTFNLRRLYKHSKLFLLSLGLISVAIFSLFPGITQNPGAWNFGALGFGHHNMLLFRSISYIPANASVLTQGDIFPQVSDRLDAYVYYNTSTVDYILIDKSSWWYTNSLLAVEYQLKYGPQPPFPQYVDKLIRSRQYGLLAYGDQIFLYKRGYNGVPIKLN